MDPRIRKALEVVQVNPANTVTQLASTVNLSYSRLEHLFKSQMGAKLIDHIHEARFRKAAVLLRRELSVKTIAAELGYKHLASFSRAFKRRVGVAPAHWRKATENVNTIAEIDI